jgi:hypothetical protein
VGVATYDIPTDDNLLGNNFLTPWRTVLREKLRVTQLLKKFPNWVTDTYYFPEEY